MQIKSLQKMNANQVICGECGNLCDFSCDKCPACGAPLFGNEPQNSTEPNNKADENGEREQPKENAKTNAQKHAEFSDSNDSKTAQLSERQIKKLLSLVCIGIILVLMILAMLVGIMSKPMP